MGSASKQEKERMEILATAKEILSKKGSRSFSMREVARAYGKRVSHIQYYFPSLDALLAALFDVIIDEEVKRIDEAVVNNSDELKFLIDLVIANFQDESLCKLVWETWINSMSSDKTSCALNDFYIKYIERVKIIIHRKTPDISDDEAKQKAVMCVSLFEGLSVLYMTGKDSFITFDINKLLLDTVNRIINA